MKVNSKKNNREIKKNKEAAREKYIKAENEKVLNAMKKEASIYKMPAFWGLACSRMPPG